MTTASRAAVTDPSAGAVPEQPRPPPGRRRVALLGAGYIAEWHARVLAAMDDVELVAVCDTALVRARALAARYGIRGAHASLRELLEVERPDAVHVLLPPDRHFAAAKELLEAGVDVLLEKPMCARVEECDALLEVAAATGRALAVAHNFSFADPYERLRQDVKAGLLGPLDQVTITWHRELPQVRHGPFDIWMLREPENAMLEIGSHAVAHALDLLGPPEHLRAWASHPVELPTGTSFYRRWKVDGEKDGVGLELRFSFGQGFTEHSVHVRGRLGSALADLDRDAYVLRRHHACGEDLDRFRGARDEGASLRSQASRTLRRYVLSKLHLERYGSPYASSIAGAATAFHAAAAQGVDDRVSARTGAKIIRVCHRIGELAALPRRTAPTRGVPQQAPGGVAPRVLVLGATGFIGQALVRQLVAAGRGVKLLVRNPSKLPPDLRGPLVTVVPGDLERAEDLRAAMQDTDCVYHLARPIVKSWEDYRLHEIEATRQVGEVALASGVKRLVYTGTIDSYYAGARAGVITEATPLDPHIARRNHYAHAKAESERLLLALHRERGLPLVIFRPGIVVGRGGGPFHWGVGMWWYDSACQVWGAGENPLPFVLVDDVARALVTAQEAEGLEGESFNLVGDVRLSAREYLDEIDRCGGMSVRRQATSIVRFYLLDLLKWSVKTAVRHPERRFPSYRDWESRTQRATWDCSRAKEHLGWQPIADRSTFVREGIDLPMREYQR